MKISLKKLSRFEKIFIKIAKVYVKQYNNYSFCFKFDDFVYPKIGISDKTIKVIFKNAQETFNRIFTEGSLGLGESYCEGNIQVADKDYKEFLMIFIRVVSDKKFLFSLYPVDIFFILKAKFTRSHHARKNQYENINSHYSLGDWFENEEDSNQFYLQWLDSPYIQYSCAKWDENTKSLADAQINKFEFYAKRLGINKNSAGKQLLDLGCGWGGFMFYMAEKYNLQCKGLTLSIAQKKYVEKEIERRNLIGQIEVELKNIHDLVGKYDFIVGIGLLEHLDDYDDLYNKSVLALKKAGRVLFHSMFHTIMFYKGDSFLTKYIFPGGGTPNLKQNVKIFQKYFKYVETKGLPKLSYPKTLDCWFDKFCENEKNIRNLLEKKGKCGDVDYSIRVFKHYLVLSSCGLTVAGVMANILAYSDT
ncbi:class I SAM-dependent methyltransferase [Patescibacteria group bacterium]|nr:class I SAM-dependent methyltransferase [Patescibacteria group bacterium]